MKMTGEKKQTMKSLSQEILILKEQVKEIDPLKQKVLELIEMIKNLNIKENNEERNSFQEIPQVVIKCKLCEIAFETKTKLKKHIKETHPSKIECQKCDKVFTKNCQLEVHIKNQHDIEKEYTCELCDKTFVLKWRFLKHQESHTDPTRRKCHYFNNEKDCPYEKIGCMFAHEASEICKFGKMCCKKLCSYQHTKSLYKTQERTKTWSYHGMESSSIFRTSTPKKMNECEDCADKTECVECIVKRVQERHGGVTTAPCTPTPSCCDLGSSSCSPSGCGGASSSFS